MLNDETIMNILVVNHHKHSIYFMKHKYE